MSAATALMVLLGAALSGCASEEEPRPPVAVAAVSDGPVQEAGPVPEEAPLAVPGWLPEDLPLPQNVQTTGVRAEQCGMSFLAPGTHAEDMSAMLVQQARAEGLSVRVVSSVSSTPPPVVLTDDLFGDEPEVPAEPITHAVVLEIGGALLTLTSRSDGVVLGTYDLDSVSCDG